MASGYRRATAAVSSVDPSSTTMISGDGYVWLRALSMASARNLPWL